MPTSSPIAAPRNPANTPDDASPLLAMVAALVPSIHAMNRQWKAAQTTLGATHLETLALRDLKHELQLRLVALATPFGWIERAAAEQTENGREVVGLRLCPPLLDHPHCEGHADAAHVPVDDETRPSADVVVLSRDLDLTKHQQRIEIR